MGLWQAGAIFRCDYHLFVLLTDRLNPLATGAMRGSFRTMKSFFASFLGTIAGLLLVFVGGGALMVVFLMAAAALAEPKTAAVDPGSYLVFDLRTNITESPSQFDDAAFSAAFSGVDVPGQLQHRLVTRALHEAATDDRIAGVVIKGSFMPSGLGTSFASLMEVRRALAAIKDAGKPIKAYLEYPDARDLYLASVADEISLDPNGAILMPGLASQPTFFAGMLDRFGIGIQTAKAGKYKSAIEPYTRSDLSPENREQLEVILDDLWSVMRDDIASARGMSPDDLQNLIDGGDAFLADDVVAAGMVDRLVYLDVFLDELKAATGRTNSSRPFKQVSLEAYVAQINQVKVGPEAEPAESGNKSGRIGLVIAEGVIVDGEGRFDQVGGARYARAIREMRQDPNIKALVLRVNSPGGSATASDQIRRELALAAEKMPVIVSMGGYAASGGYWISAEGKKIFAEPTTITGSIGVYGMLINIQELANEYGVTWDTVKTGHFADAATLARPKTAEEMALFQRSVSKIYSDFIALVADGRQLEAADVEAVAQGRVWSGVSAQKVGLVDELGGLADALAEAAKQADLDRGARLREFPRKRAFADAIAEALNRMPAKIMGPDVGLVGQLVNGVEKVSDELGDFNDPRGIYARMPLEYLF